MSKPKLKVCWISAGVSSFIAGYLVRDTVDKFIYIDVADQHHDSLRFIYDAEKILGKQINIIRSTEYTSVEDCIRQYGRIGNLKTGFYPCTNWLKKRVRKQWEYEHRDFDITYVWGFDLNENSVAVSSHRLARRGSGRWEVPRKEKVRHNLAGDGDYRYECSACRHSDEHNENVHVPFCWYCGAKMEVE